MAVGIVGTGKDSTTLYQLKVKRIHACWPRSAARTTDAANNKSIVNCFFIDYGGYPQSVSRMGLIKLPLGNGARLAAWDLLDVNVAR